MLRDDIKWDIGINTDALMDGVTGRVGNFVFRTLDGVTVVSRRPKKPTSESAVQRDNRERFRHAAEFAKKELLDPERRKYYEKLLKQRPKLRNAYTVAIKEFMNRRETVVKRVEAVSEKKVCSTMSLKRNVNVQGEIMVNRPGKRRQFAFEGYNQPTRHQGKNNYLSAQSTDSSLRGNHLLGAKGHRVRDECQV